MQASSEPFTPSGVTSKRRLPPPVILKFDMSLIRSIHRASSSHLQMVATLVKMVLDLGVVPLAEGIEEDAERITCEQLGFRLAQGFFFGRPFPLQAGNG